jgi:hypothetical protein
VKSSGVRGRWYESGRVFNSRFSRKLHGISPPLTGGDSGEGDRELVFKREKESKQ